ncbi:MAG: DEAD/DEAH box helicase, partial [Nitrospirae bacterium]|nr:DEAD/DEAH box helicase [Nitrospirota bacterium]
MQLKTFLDQYGPQISGIIEKSLTPIYNPLSPEGIEEYEEKIPSLIRKPFPVQGEVIKGISKAMYKDEIERIFLCGEMGSGKTMVSLSVIAMSPEPLRTLVVCPTHLVEKWIRETKQTVPDVHIVDLSVRGVISILDALRGATRPETHEVYIISKERAKLSYGWRPAAIKKMNSRFPHCPDCGLVVMENDKYVTWESLGRKKRFCDKCRAALWQADRKLKRYAPAEYIKKYLKGFFDFVILDEIQDYKAGSTLQGLAMGSLLSVAPKCLCLTGTLNSGYADDLFYLLFRMDPALLKADGFNYGSSARWLETYGTLEFVVKLDEEDHYYGRGKRKKETLRKKPGVSPLVVGKYVLDKACFIRLADVIDGLPPYEENVVTIKMDTLSGQSESYRSLEGKLKDAVRMYHGKALSSMLQALLSYPDSCSLFPEHIEIEDKKTGELLAVIEAPLIELEEGTLLPKEKELVKLVRNETRQGRKVLCYLTFTNTRDIRPRLKKILEDANFRVGVLDASVAPKKREAWIEKHAKNIDVLLVNAELVKTGLDLYDFPTVVFYQIGYNIFTLRQAARRSWRIGQHQPVRVFFFCYEGTMQEIALSLIAKKLEVALIVEGDLPEGLAEYVSTGESIVEEMAKALVEGGSYGGAEKAWANFRKKEIEIQLGISGKESIFSEASQSTLRKSDVKAKTTIDKNVVVRVSIVEGKKKKQS